MIALSSAALIACLSLEGHRAIRVEFAESPRADVETRALF